MTAVLGSCFAGETDWGHGYYVNGLASCRMEHFGRRGLDACYAGRFLSYIELA